MEGKGKEEGDAVSRGASKPFAFLQLVSVQKESKVIIASLSCRGVVCLLLFLFILEKNQRSKKKKTLSFFESSQCSLQW